MGRKRRRFVSRRELAIGMIGPAALATALGIGLLWLQQPVKLEVSVAGAQADHRAPASDRAAPATLARGDLTETPILASALPDGGASQPILPMFRTVCCRRADNTAYWTAAEWCDDVGAAVDDRMCDVQLPALPSATKPAPAGAPAPEAMTFTQCLRMSANDDLGTSLDARCSVLLETVCCERRGRVGEAMRGDCQESGPSREVDPQLCEPICCHRPSVPSTLWDNRGNCGDVSDRHALIVAEDKCEEVCCQMPAGSMRRDGRRACAARGGSARALSTCGTTVTVENKELVDSERGHLAEDVGKVDVETMVNPRLPAVSPFQ
jgi:hypothetical protein